MIGKETKQYSRELIYKCNKLRKRKDKRVGVVHKMKIVLTSSGSEVVTDFLKEKLNTPTPIPSTITLSRPLQIVL